MNDTQKTQQENMDLVARVGPHIETGFKDSDRDLFAQEVVFHFFNHRLPELAGDHHGLEGISAFFARLSETSDTGFHNEPHSLTPFGDELVVAYATNTLSFDGAEIDVDAVLVWRVFDGRIREFGPSQPSTQCGPTAEVPIRVPDSQAPVRAAVAHCPARLAWPSCGRSSTARS